MQSFVSLMVGGSVDLVYPEVGIGQGKRGSGSSFDVQCTADSMIWRNRLKVRVDGSRLRGRIFYANGSSWTREPPRSYLLQLADGSRVRVETGQHSSIGEGAQTPMSAIVYTDPQKSLVLKQVRQPTTSAPSRATA